MSARRSLLRPGQVAIVTGASSGIGWACARAFAQRGVRVVAVARREERLRALREETAALAPGSDFLVGDLSERAFAEHVVDRTVETQGRLDVLVNNAGMPKHKQVYDLSAEEVEHVMRVNYLSAVWTSLRALPALMAGEGGCIVNVSSFAARVVPPREPAYAASKAALSAWTEGLQHDLAGSGVHVGLVHPGPIDTEIWERTDEEAAYAGPRYPARVVVDAIFDVIERGRFDATAPRRNPALMAARALRLLAPSLLRRGMARMDPVPRARIERAREHSASVFGSEGPPGRYHRGMAARIDELRETLGQLHQHLEENAELDEELRTELRAAAGEIQSALDASGDGAPDLPESTLDRLRDQIARFEGSHPTLTGIAGRIVDALAELGI